MFTFGAYVDKANALSMSEARVAETQKRSETAHKALQDVKKEKMGIDSSLREQRLKSEALEKENADLKVKLQAKKDSEAKAAAEAAKTAQVAVKPTQAAPVAAISGSKSDWLASSGIPSSEWTYVDYIVTKESGWNPNAVNASSGACGLGQQLPCGKWAGAWNDPVAALRAMDGYAKGRYGSWSGAYSAWISKNWW